MSYKIAILASGSGTNAENITRYFSGSDLARVTLVLTNVRDAGVVARMQPLGVDTYYVPDEQWRGHPERIADFLVSEGIDLVVLAGFMRKVDDVIVERFRGRMLNIHPSLLPAYGGKGMYGHHVHEAVIAAGEKESGVTVHQVSEVMDGGSIVAQEKIEVMPDDTPASLESRIHEVEYRLYPRAIEQVLEESGGENGGEGSDGDSVAGQWASALGVDYDEAVAHSCPGEQQVPPPVPHQEPPVYVPANAHEMEQPPMPATYLLWSVLCIVFCCTVPGIVATVFSCQVSSKYYSGDYEGAARASRRAQIWIIAAFCAGVLQATIFTPLYMILGA